MKDKEPKQWITVNGNHIPIYEGESRDAAIKKFFNKSKNTINKNEDKKYNDIKSNKDDADSKNLPKKLPLKDIDANEANESTTILDLKSWKRYEFVKNSKITGAYIFAGKGTSKEFRDADKFAKKINGKTENMQHCAGYADIVKGDKVFKGVEVHWVQEENGLPKLAFVKKYKKGN